MSVKRVIVGKEYRSDASDVRFTVVRFVTKYAVEIEYTAPLNLKGKRNSSVGTDMVRAHRSEVK